MLDAIGVKSVEDLFASIPANVRRDGPIDIKPQSEWALSKEIRALAAQNFSGTAFLGAGCYPHDIPAHIPYLAMRSEFLTSYTPYQPEVSQGTLQAIFEFQTMTANLLGTEVANASMYDGANSVAEGALMAIRVKKKHKVAYSRLLHPHYVEEMKTYFRPAGFEAVELPVLPDGRTDLSKIPDDVSAVVVQSPNFAGVIEDLEAAAKAAHCHEFIMALPEGYNTKAGEAGGAMSGGERQRITLARAILKPASTIILDEATAYADPENEALIQEAISHLVKGKNLVIVAHRLNTIKQAHQIILIDKGQIIAKGRHEELMETPLYANLWKQYLGEE